MMIRRLLPICLSLFISSNASGAIVFDSGSTANERFGDDVLTWSHTTTGSSDANTVMILSGGNEGGLDALDSADYNGDSFTVFNTTDCCFSQIRMHHAYLYFPDSGINTVTFDSADTCNSCLAGVATYTGVATGGPLQSQDNGNMTIDDAGNLAFVVCVDQDTANTAVDSPLSVAFDQNTSGALTFTFSGGHEITSTSGAKTYTCTNDDSINSSEWDVATVAPASSVIPTAKVIMF